MSRILAVLSLLGLLILSVGCESQRLDRLEKRTKDLEGEVGHHQAIADYDLQAKCAKEAKTWFNENWRADKDTLLLTYTDHYNRKLNKCFLVVENHYTVANSLKAGFDWINDTSLWDVQENAKYASFAEDHLVRNGKTYDSVITCEMESTKCHTLKEFNTLVGSYMRD